MLDINILVIDDHQLFREAIVTKLEQEEAFNVIGQLDNAVDALIFAKQHNPDIILMDINLEGMDGLEATKLLKSAEIECKVIILSMHSDDHHIGMALSLGVWGYIRKQEAFDDLITAIRHVYVNKRYYSPSLNIDPKLHRPKKAVEGVQLSDREREIVIFVAKGLSNSDIAKLVNLSKRTVETHRLKINRKLGTGNVADLTRYAIRKD